MEKRAVSIDDLSTEQLILLNRDGKLNGATVEKLQKQGKLPLENGTFQVVKSTPNAAKKQPVLSTPDPASPVETPTPLHTDRPNKRKKKAKK